MAAMFLCLRLSPAVGADAMEIPGTGACEVLLQGVAEAFNARHPESRVTVPPSIGTVGAMRVVLSDQAVLVRVARPLTKEEKEQGLAYRPFARDMVIFAVGSKVPVRNITTAQLVEIYSGRITSWQALGGPNAPIRLLLRQPGDSSLLVIQKHIEAFRNISFHPAAKLAYTDNKMLDLLQKYHHGIGWLTFSALKKSQSPLHPLVLDGVSPTPENARSQQYSLLEEYALVFKENRLDALATSFLNFLFSPEGQKVMEQFGAVPLPQE